MIIKELGMDATEVIVCGDRFLSDLLPAKKLGCRTIKMQWGRGLNSPAYLDQVDHCVTNMTELKTIINSYDYK